MPTTETKADEDTKKPPVSHKVIFWLILIVGFALYTVSIFNNINAIRKIHGGFIKGFYFQKECDDEYTEYESLRHHTYNALKNERAALDVGSYMNLLLLFWMPVATLLLLTGHMIGVSLIWTGVMAIVLVYVAYAMSKLYLNPTYNGRLYQFFEGSYCDTASTSITVMRRFQTFLILITGAIIYGYYALHSKYENGTKTVYLNKFPTNLDKEVVSKIRSGDEKQYPVGYLLYQYATKRNYLFYGLVVVWLFAYLWVFLTTKHYNRLREHVLCHYDNLMAEYKVVLETYIYPDPESSSYATQEAYDKETEKRYNDIKDRMERNYLRIHEIMPLPSITEDTVGDYAIYLMNWRGREFEDLPESPELNKLREFMYRLRNDRVYQRTLEDFMKISKRYLLFHLIVILYIVFHVLYKNTTIQRGLIFMIGVGVIVGLFALSWYAWFDVALRI
jgi:hypothetical protein